MNPTIPTTDGKNYHSGELTNPSHKRFKRARKASGLSQVAAANLSGVSQGKISKIENGTQEPTQEQAEVLAEVYGVTVSFFNFNDKMDKLGSVPSLYRRGSMSQKGIDRFDANEHIIRDCVEILLDSVDLDPQLRLDRYPDSCPEQAARDLRVRWMIPKGPIPNLTAYLEAAGILILPVESMPTKIDAVFLPPVHNLSPIFLTNPNIPGDRLRLSLAHELGHYVMQHHIDVQNTKDCEAEAWAFAAEFLMPEKQIKASLKNANMNKLVQLKPKWGTSIAALMRRAMNLKAITESRYRSLNIELSKKQWRKIEPVPIEREEPSLLRQIVNIHYDELGYTSHELARALTIRHSKFYELFAQIIPPAPLRIL